MTAPSTLHHLPGQGTTRRAPVLFVHGAFGTPWVWRRNFMPWFAGRGHDVYALRLRGAGNLPGSYIEPGLGDYLDDLEEAVREIGIPPVVVAHSLGALVAQMGIGRVPMCALAMLAPVPPTGMFWSSFRLALNAPALWARTALSAADAGFASTAATREALFTEDSDADAVGETHVNLTSQPARPLLEAQWPRHIPRAARLNIPAMTLAAEFDRLIPTDAVVRTARYHGATHLTVSGSGHAMMLDDAWRDAAAGISEWLERTH